MATLETGDLLRLSFWGHARSSHALELLSMLGIAIGVAAVVLLTSLGEGARRYIVAQFSQFGTNVLAINPGKIETGGIPGHSVAPRASSPSRIPKRSRACP